MRTRSESQPAVLILGLCPAVVVSTRVIDALFMSAGVVLVLASVSMLLPVIRRLTAEEPHRLDVSLGRARHPGILWGTLLLTSCLAAAYELVLSALAPAAASRLGIYVPLIAVSFLVTGRLEVLAGSPSLRVAALDALRTGAAFTGILVTVALVREILGAGTVTLASTLVVRPFFDNPARALGLAGGALLCLGYAEGAVRLTDTRRAEAKGEDQPG